MLVGGTFGRYRHCNDGRCVSHRDRNNCLIVDAHPNGGRVTRPHPNGGRVTRPHPNGGRVTRPHPNGNGLVFSDPQPPIASP